MKQSYSEEGHISSASQEIILIVWNQKVRHRLHKGPPLVPLLSQITPVHSPMRFLGVDILPSTPRFSKWAVSLRFPHTNPSYIHRISHTFYTPTPSHSSLISSARGYVMKSANHDVPLTSNVLQMKSEDIHD